MSTPRLSEAHVRQLVEFIRDQRIEIRSLRREVEATQSYLLWMAMRIHYLETVRPD